jgi:large subunit ribosomal protein L18Ae
VLEHPWNASKSLEIRVSRFFSEFVTAVSHYLTGKYLSAQKMTRAQEKTKGRQLRQYVVCGRLLPTKNNPVPKIYRMTIFAPNSVIAESRFWYFTSKLRRVKHANGEILHSSIVHEKKPGTIKNYGFWIRYTSRTNIHNMYKEFRDTTLEGAARQLFDDMAARHRAHRNSIQIIRSVVVKSADLKRPHTRQLAMDNGLKFPNPHRLPRPSNPKFAKTFAYNKPTTLF